VARFPDDMPRAKRHRPDSNDVGLPAGAATSSRDRKSVPGISSRGDKTEGSIELAPEGPSGTWKEAEENTVVISDVEPAAVNLFLEWFDSNPDSSHVDCEVESRKMHCEVESSALRRKIGMAKRDSDSEPD
jgi:hypothetical protein